MFRLNLSSLDAIFDQCMPIPECGCWIWMRSLNRDGYGQANLAWRPRLIVKKVHRIAYELANGSIPDGLTLDHLCRVHSCCNPTHLEPVTNRINILRGISFSAQNARKTHCRQGHELAGDNLMAYPLAKGFRSCRACRVLSDRRRRSTKPGNSNP